MLPINFVGQLISQRFCTAHMLPSKVFFNGHALSVQQTWNLEIQGSVDRLVEKLYFYLNSFYTFHL